MDRLLLKLPIFIFSSVAAPLLSQEPVYKEPWFTVHIKNESQQICFVTGYSKEQMLQADIMNPSTHITFRVSDDQPVNIPTASGIYRILIGTFFNCNGFPLKPYAVFEKIKTGKVSNKIGPVIMFRTYYSIAPCGEQLDFILSSADTLLLDTPKNPLLPEIALQRPTEAFIPPFSS